MSTGASSRAGSLRLDQYLQRTGIIKRRTIAKELCDAGRVLIDGRPAKAGHEVKSGDELSVRLRDRRSSYRVKDVPAGNIRKEDRENYVELTNEELFHED
jgi:ribosomal 50S subunit-recycling heat shock protein